MQIFFSLLNHPGEIQKKGMLVPMSADLYRPILKRLKQEGIVAKESVTEL